jgi:hypothetical protein
VFVELYVSCDFASVYGASAWVNHVHLFLWDIFSNCVCFWVCFGNIVVCTSSFCSACCNCVQWLFLSRTRTCTRLISGILFREIRLSSPSHTHTLSLSLSTCVTHFGLSHTVDGRRMDLYCTLARIAFCLAVLRVRSISRRYDEQKKNLSF